MNQSYSVMLGVFLLSLLGLIWGSGYSIAFYATTHGVHPMGYAFWQSIGPAILLTLILLFKGQLQTAFLQIRFLRFYLISGLLGIALPNTNMYFVAPHLPAGLLAVIINTVPIATFLIAWISKEETFNWVRLSGVGVCFIGIMLLVLPHANLPSTAMVPWILQALITPLCFALCAVYSSKHRPPSSNALLLAAGMLICSSIFLLPITLLTKHFYFPVFPLQTRDWVIVLEIILSTIGYLLFFQLLKIAGAVYYSLTGGVVALTGLFWGWMLFHDHYTSFVMLAIIFILCGVVIVSFKRN